MTQQVCFLIMWAGVLGLAVETLWRSWHFPGRVADPSELFARKASPRLAYAFGPAAPPWMLEQPYAGFSPGAAAVTLEYAGPDPVPANDGAGATAEWSPLAEVAAVGQSLEDWWSERLQEYDAALKRIDEALRDIEGHVWHPPMASSWPYCVMTTAENAAQFVAGSQRLPAYRALRLAHTGEFSPREAMQLEALLSS